MAPLSKSTPSMAPDTYQLVVFGCQRIANFPRYSHTWAVFLKSQEAKHTPPLREGEQVVISWLPVSLDIDLTGPPEAGKNFSLSETRDIVHTMRSELKSWGPLQIRKKLYDLAAQRVEELESGTVQYVVGDDDYRPDQATNCIHALSDLGLTKRPLVRPQE